MTTCSITPLRAPTTEDRLLQVATILEASLATPAAPGLPTDNDPTEPAERYLIAAIDGTDDPDDPHVPDPMGVSDHVALLVKPLYCHPALELRGFVAPPDWWCLGVSAGGWASTFDPDRPGAPRPTGTDRRRVRITQVIDRSGASVSILREPAAEPVVSQWQGPSIDHCGLLDDCLRRALGLPTTDPPDDTAELWSLMWIDRLLHLATGGELDHADWPAVAMRHPAFDFIRHAHDPELERWAVDHLDRAGHHLISAHSWASVHHQSAQGLGVMAGLFDQDVAWMDVGMFARMATGVFAPLDDALDDLASFLPDRVLRQIICTLDRWGQTPWLHRSIATP